MIYSRHCSPEVRQSVGSFFEFDAVNNVLRCSLKGHVTEDILMNVYSQFVRFNASHPPCRGIVDCANVTSVDISSRAVWRLVHLPLFSSAQLMHIVVAPKDLSYAPARMLSMFGKELRPNHGIVRSIGVAYTALGIKSPYFSRISID